MKKTTRVCKKCFTRKKLDTANFRKTKGYFSNICKSCSYSSDSVSRSMRKSGTVYRQDTRIPVEELAAKYDKVFAVLEKNKVITQNSAAQQVDKILTEICD